MLAAHRLVSRRELRIERRPDQLAGLGEALARGLVLLSCGSHGNVIRILVPLTVSDAVLDEGLAILAQSLAAALI